jgi:hypothetical protein
MQNFFKFGRNFVAKLQTTPSGTWQQWRRAEEKVENSHQLTYITKKITVYNFRCGFGST